MTSKQIKDFSKDSSPADTDMFLKSNKDGGLTTVTYADLKNRINQGLITHKLVTSSDDLNSLKTPGVYYANGVVPANWPEMINGSKWAEIRVRDVYHNLEQTITLTGGFKLRRFGPYENVANLQWGAESGVATIPTKGATSCVYTTIHGPSGYLVVMMKGVAHIKLENLGSPSATVTNIVGNELGSVSVTGTAANGYRLVLNFNGPQYDSVKVIG
jgi:hypothetical protein